MPPKPIDISAAAVVDLKAQLAQYTEQFEKDRSGSKVVSAAARRPDKKPTVWRRQNKGVEQRSQRDRELEPVEVDALTRSRQGLERKAQLYEKLRKRVDHSDYEDDEELLIDFDRKYWEERELQRDGKRTKREKSPSEEDDPWVEIVDEFGRTRIVRQSEVPQPESYSDDDGSDEEGSMRPRIPRDPEYANRSDIRHYDATSEIRTRGVGFYQFATDDEQRKEQMERLNQLRRETEQARKNTSTVAERRKAMLNKQAEKIQARRAALLAKRQGQQEKTPTETQDTSSITAPNEFVVNEDSVTDFLQSVRKTIGNR